MSHEPLKPPADLAEDAPTHFLRMYKEILSSPRHKARGFRGFAVERRKKTK